MMLACIMCVVAVGVAWEPVGPEFRVNEYVMNHQSTPDLCGVEGGGFVVTWQSDGQDGDGYGVYQRAFDADGTATTGEERVNAKTTNWQQSSIPRSLGNAGYAVVWEASGSQDGDRYGVFLKIYHPQNGTNTSTIQVNTETAFSQFKAALSTIPDTGKIIVAWQSDNQDSSGFGVYVQQFVYGVRVGLETRANVVTTSGQDIPAVAYLSSGEYVVVWRSSETGNDLIYCRVFDGAVGGAVLLVTEDTSTTNSDPDISSTLEGWVIVWTSSSDIRARQYTLSGTAGPEFVVNAVTANTQTRGVVLGLPQGGFVAAWESAEPTGWEIIMQSFTPSGIRDGQRVVATDAVSSVSTVKIALLSPTRVALVWHADAADSSGWGIYSRIFQFPPTPAPLTPFPDTLAPPTVAPDTAAPLTSAPPTFAPSTAVPLSTYATGCGPFPVSTSGPVSITYELGEVGMKEVILFMCSFPSSTPSYAAVGIRAAQVPGMSGFRITAFDSITPNVVTDYKPPQRNPNSTPVVNPEQHSRSVLSWSNATTTTMGFYIPFDAVGVTKGGNVNVGWVVGSGQAGLTWAKHDFSDSRDLKLVTCGCGCMDEWEHNGKRYKGCETTRDKTMPWCAVDASCNLPWATCLGDSDPITPCVCKGGCVNGTCVVKNPPCDKAPTPSTGNEAYMACVVPPPPPIVVPKEKTASQITGATVGGAAVLAASSGISMKGTSRVSRAMVFLSVLECPRMQPEELGFILNPSRLVFGSGLLQEYRGALVGNMAIVVGLYIVLLAVAMATSLRRGVRDGLEVALSMVPTAGFYLVVEFFWTPTLQSAFAMCFYGPPPQQAASGIVLFTAIAYMVYIRVLSKRATSGCTLVTTQLERKTVLQKMVRAEYEWEPMDKSRKGRLQIEYLSAVFDGFHREQCNYYVVQLVMMTGLACLSAWNPKKQVACAGRAGVLTIIPAVWMCLLVKDLPYLRQIDNGMEIVVSLSEFVFSVVGFWGMATENTSYLETSGRMAMTLVYIVSAKFVLEVVLWLHGVCSEQLAQPEEEEEEEKSKEELTIPLIVTEEPSIASSASVSASTFTPPAVPAVTTLHSYPTLLLQHSGNLLKPISL